MRTLSAVLAASTMLTGFALAATAAEIYPLDRATILAGSPFDFKVELDGVAAEDAISVLVNGKPVAEALGKPAEYVAEENDEEGAVMGSALILRGVTLAEPGTYTVEIKAAAPPGRFTAPPPRPRPGT